MPGNDVITYLCDACDRRLEVDAELVGRKAACPYCGNITVVRARRPGHPAPVPAPAPAPVPERERPPRPAPKDTPSSMGLPPDSGPEVHVLTIHPVTVRAHPVRGFGVVLGIAASIAGATWLFAAARRNRAVMPADPDAAPVETPSTGLPGLFDDAGGWATVATIGMYACLLLALAGLITLAVWWVLKRSVALIITNKRTTLREGLFSRNSREVLHDRIQDIQVRQTFLQRILRTGSIGISNAGGGGGDAGVEIQAHDLPNPLRIRAIIDAYRGNDVQRASDDD
ncbi:MAG: PH domain-containing protein [Phycisphaeraceae bacterium]|nr:PH domain-containing protein [Phycisphaeraceae bacterium]